MTGLVRQRRKRDTELLSITAAIEDILQENEGLTAERLAMVAAGMGSAVVITDATDPDGPIMYASAAFCALTGYFEAEVLGRNCRFLQGRHTSPASVERIHQAIVAGHGITLDIYNYRKDGTPFWNELAVSPIRDRQKRARYFVGLPKDVTARKAARARLELREAQFSTFFDRSGLGVALTDDHGVFLLVNGVYATMLGYSETELSARNVVEVTHPDDVAAGIDLLSQILGGTRDHYEVEQRYLRKDGETIWGHVTFSAVRDPDARVLQVMSVVYDITERKQREAQLVFQEQLLESVGQAVIATEPDGAITYWNRAAEALYGWPAQDVIGRNVADVTSAAISQVQAAEIMSGLSTGESWSGEFSVRRRDGSEFQALVTDTPVLNEHGTFVGIIGVSSDITVQKQTIELLRASVDGAPIGMALLDRDGRIVNSNVALRKALGYSEDELHQIKIADCVHPDDVLKHKTAYHDLLHGVIHRYQQYVRYIRKEGQLIWGQETVSGISLDGVSISHAVYMQEDITEQRQAEEALRRSEARFRAVFENAQTGIVVSDPSGRVLETNVAYQRMLGYDEHELRGLSYVAYTHPDDAAQQQVAYRVGASSSRDHQQMEKRYVRKDGTTAWGRLNGSLVRGADGEPLLGIGLVEDITSRKETEQALGESEDRYRKLVELSPEPIVVLVEGKVVYANPAAFLLLGSSRADQLIGQEFRDFVHPEFRALAAAHRNHVEETGEGATLTEYKLLRCDGEAVDVETMSMSITYTGEPATLIMLRDTTERKRRDIELHHVLAERSAILGQTVEGVVVTDPAGSITFVNDAAKAIHGVDSLGILPDAYSDVYHLFTMDGHPYPPNELPLARVVLHNETVLDALWRIRRPDGREVVAEGSAKPVLMEDGTRIGAVLTLRDVTDRIQAEEQQARIVQREQEVASQFRHIERWRTAFLRIMAHELRTPFGQITGFADLLESEADRLTERGRRYLSNIRAASDRIEPLMQRSLELMHLYSDHTHTEMSMVDLGHIIERCLLVARARAEAKALTIRYEGPREPIHARGNARQLEQVLDILLDNAMKFTPDGGSIDVGIRRREHRTEVAVSDTGPGIPEDMREYIFAGQAEDFLTRRQGGTGLGLMMARRILELHGGTLSLEPSEHGACFALTLYDPPPHKAEAPILNA